VAPSQRDNSCDEAQKGGSSSGEGDEEEEEDEESESPSKDDSKQAMLLMRREKSVFDRILSYAICKQDSKDSPAKSQCEMVLDDDVALKRKVSRPKAEPRDEQLIII